MRTKWEVWLFSHWPLLSRVMHHSVWCFGRGKKDGQPWGFWPKQIIYLHDSDMALLYNIDPCNSDIEFCNKSGHECKECGGFWYPTVTHCGDSDTLFCLCQNLQCLPILSTLGLYIDLCIKTGKTWHCLEKKQLVLFDCQHRLSEIERCFLTANSLILRCTKVLYNWLVWKYIDILSDHDVMEN